jgi:hypothetical protein
MNKVSVLFLLLFGLVAETSGQGNDIRPVAKKEDRTNAPTCSGMSANSSKEKVARTSQDRHSVTLSWNASAPASKSRGDAIQGYRVYRSSKSHVYSEKDRISQTLLSGTRCVDASVEAGKTYYYIVKAVNGNGKQSVASAEIEAKVPSP